MDGGFWECERLGRSPRCRRASPRRLSPYDLLLALFFLCDLGIVDSAAEALFASRFLQVFQALLLLFQFRLHAFNLILLLFLGFIPLCAVGNLVCADGLAQAANFAVQRSNRVLQRLNLELPLLGCSLAIFVTWLRGRWRWQSENPGVGVSVDPRCEAISSFLMMWGALGGCASLAVASVPGASLLDASFAEASLAFASFCRFSRRA